MKRDASRFFTVLNPARARRFRRAYREHLATWCPVEWPDYVLAAQKMKAEIDMAQQDAMIESGRGIYGRITASMLRAGPLRTDDWIPSPEMRGVGRRLGRLSAAEMDVG